MRWSAEPSSIWHRYRSAAAASASQLAFAVRSFSAATVESDARKCITVENPVENLGHHRRLRWLRTCRREATRCVCDVDAHYHQQTGPNSGKHLLNGDLLPEGLGFALVGEVRPQLPRLSLRGLVAGLGKGRH